MSEAAVEEAHAKINLHLRIGAREADGYHSLETIFQALELHDTLEARVADATTLQVEGDVDVGPQERNLVLRAAEAFRRRFADAPHVAFRLIKRIPAGAGLGGGSSDAAAALRALNTLAGSPLDNQALRDIGTRIGSDVAFFLCGSPIASATGRGELLTPLAPLAAADVIIVDPGFSVPTKDAFAWWDQADRRKQARSEAIPQARSFGALRAVAHNDFEWVVFARHPELGAVRRALALHGADLAMLSGSGSCVYGIFERGVELQGILRSVLAEAPRARLLRTRTLT